ncbi:hypothetical protein K2173_002216 [Erythroxylum novogranatense]|uniref:Uncharacterized protein n=1 Tax=Erythroxylum novogranatense TaxID=1862640 RepID=A0AAV8T9J8_9ROSI|nr:hypothetical protein K2173_002216 [Erythroxylum novogranatense]
MQYSKFKDFRASLLGKTSGDKQILPGDGQPTRMELDKDSLESGGGTSSLREEEPMPKVDDGFGDIFRGICFEHWLDKMIKSGDVLVYGWFVYLVYEEKQPGGCEAAVGNGRWFLRFSECSVQSLVAPVSNHDLLLLDTSPDSQHMVCRRFRFDNAWLLDANLEAVVVAGWMCEGEVDLLHKKDNCVAELQLWGKRRNRDRNMKRVLVHKLLQERRAGTDGGDLDRLRAEWNLLLEEDEVRRR